MVFTGSRLYLENKKKLKSWLGDPAPTTTTTTTAETTTQRRRFL